MMGIEKLKEIWPQWQVLGEIGRGSFGVVYKAVREEHGVTSYCAIKVISIPQQEAEVKSLRADGLDEAAARNYFEKIVANTVGEIKVLESMKGTSNIVSVEDYRVEEAVGRLGWDIFIRMELLTSFIDYTSDKKLDEAAVVKLGVDICSALELCAKKNIIHRDVKPENIFISDFGDFKIGDFGIARELERSSGSLSVSGTHNYMAPEVRSKHYDATVDIYSLGLMLYKLLNNNRLPFLDPNAQLVSPQDYHTALDRRFSGEPFPDPIGASPALAKVIQVACAFDSAKRFRTATAFKNALNTVQGAAPAAKAARPAPAETISARPAMPAVPPAAGAPAWDESTVAGARPPQGAQMQENAQPQETSGAKRKSRKEKSRKPKIIMIIILICVLAGGGLYGWHWIQEKIDPANDIFAALDGGDADGALAIFRDDMNGASNKALEEGLVQRIDTLESDFKAGAIDYETAKEKLDAIEAMEIPGISARLTKTRGTVDKLYASRLAFDTAESFLKSEDYMEAVSQYKLVLPEDSNYEKAQEGVKKASDGYRVKAVAAAEALAGKEDYAGALAAMGAALKVLENDTEFMQKRTLYEAKYVSRTASDADALAAEGKYDDAVTLLQEALKTVPGNADLTAKATEITNSKPGVLSDLVVIDSQKYEAKTDIFVDSFGNKYYESYEFMPEMYNRSSYYNNDEKFNSDRAYAVYNANKGYKTFSADIVAPSGLDSDAQFLIEVYTDENIEPVWSTWDYSVRTGAAHIDINISGITKLNITVWVKNAAYYSGYPIRLVNTALTR